ncbi:helix-turn-helix domain-containing protein [Nocardia macrotermitis]|uniref:helix-turn-helix domain-containing protein n=1 Tax=Nocardia macrotermitis TaxID=2585198 RepID=UPI0012964E25|nr:helix-turn-helix transcriptional regulator [Nocardia macrotermitis]
MEEASKRLVGAGDEPTLSDLSGALRMLFLKSGMTVDECAEACGERGSLIARMLNERPMRIPPPAGALSALIRVLGVGPDHPDHPIWMESWRRVMTADRARRRSQQVIVTGNNASVKVVGEATANVSKPGSELSAERQKFFFRFLHSALLQADVTFLFTMLFTAAAACVTVCGAVMLLAYPESGAAGPTPLITTLSGLAAAGGGGAFAVHTHRSRSHVTKRADQVREDIQGDVAFERAMMLIDRIADRERKDYLLSLTAVKELGLSPAPIDLEKHLPTKRVEANRAQEIESAADSG